MYELDPGQKTFPYHYHYVLEEWLVVLRGQPTLRTPDGERALEPGDCVVFKRGPDGAHLVRNDTDDPVRVLMLSTSSDLEVAVYPDSDKVGVAAKELRVVVPRSAEVDYYHGELT